MAYCTKCGVQAQDGTQFCSSCGTAIQPTEAVVEQKEPLQENGVIQKETKQENDAEKNKGMAIIAYILFFIPLLTGDYKNSPFVKFHTNQGTILFLFSVALGITTNILLAILRAVLFNVYTWGIFGIFTTIINALWIVPTVLMVIGIINAVNERTKTLPIIGDKLTIIK